MNNKKLFRGVGVIYRHHKLNHLSKTSWRLRFKPICASTEIELSNWIAEKPVKQDQPKAIFASCQKYGQGQIGRNWYSPKGGVWVSAAINRTGSNTSHSELYGLAVALALVERVENMGIKVKIKWPNDILVDGKKLAGILTRLFFRGEELRLVRVGVGLNVLNNVPREGISLKKIIGGQKININFWSSEVLFAIERSLDFLDNKKYLRNQVEQRLWSKKYIDRGTGCKWDIKGIDLSGRLILFKDGKERRISN